MHVQAQPFLSYGVLIVNLAVYAAGLGLRFSLGESSGEDYFYMLAKVNDEVVQGEYYRCGSVRLIPINAWHVLFELSCCRGDIITVDATVTELQQWGIIAVGVCA